MEDVSHDYRLSHRGKGSAYHRNITSKGHAALIWSLEKEILVEVARQKGTIENYLDFACGTGRVLALLENMAATATGIDVSSTMLDEARQHVRRATLVNVDISVPDHAFVGRKFDLVTAFRFFPRANPPLRRAVMHSLAGLLAEGGWLVVNNHKNHSSATRRLWKVPKATMLHEDMLELARDCGLRVVATYHAGVVPVPAGIPLFPYRVLRPFESMLSRLPRLRGSASDVIYVMAR